jgi:hypothetical protein
VTDLRNAKWQRWITGTINNNVLTMYIQRDAWREVSKMLEANGQLPDSYWWEFMRDTYATTQAVAVRRQADTHRDAASLGKLIKEIRDDPGKITRGLWDEPPFGFEHVIAQNGWAEQYGGEVGDHLDPAIPTADFETLRTAAANVKAYVDEHVAHADPAAASVTLTLGQVHGAVEVIGDLFKRYYNLLTAGSYVELVPAIQHDWKAVFRVPWER